MTGTCIDLLRHGETVGGNRYRGSRDDALTAEGWEQMRRALGDDRPWTCIVSSPLIRCRAFAEGLAQRHSLSIEIETRLREIHFGDWEGKTAEELLATDRERITRFWEDPESHPPPGGEALTMFRNRVLEAWRQLSARDTSDHLLVVTHGGPIRVILGHILGLSRAEILQLEVPHAYRRQLRLLGDGVYGADGSAFRSGER